MDFPGFECCTCKARFRATVYGVGPQWERLCYLDAESGPEYEFWDGYSLETYCSPSCMEHGLPAVMALEKTPVSRVGNGPVEVCARCGGPVDMAAYHLTYVADRLDCKEPTGFEATQTILQFLGVVCSQCAPPPDIDAEVKNSDDPDWPSGNG
jgi:hypothetical protein